MAKRGKRDSWNTCRNISVNFNCTKRDAVWQGRPLIDCHRHRVISWAGSEITPCCRAWQRHESRREHLIWRCTRDERDLVAIAQPRKNFISSSSGPAITFWQRDTPTSAGVSSSRPRSGSVRVTRFGEIRYLSPYYSYTRQIPGEILGRRTRNGAFINLQ